MAEGTWVVVRDPDVHREEAPVYDDGRMSVGLDLAGGYVELIASTLDDKPENKSPPFPVPEGAVAIHNPDAHRLRAAVNNRGCPTVGKELAGETVEAVASVIEVPDEPHTPTFVASGEPDAVAATDQSERGGA